jgi:hypothetical protein
LSSFAPRSQAFDWRWQSSKHEGECDVEGVARGGGERTGGSIAVLALATGEGTALALAVLASRGVLVDDACGTGPVVGSTGAERVVQLHANATRNTVASPNAHWRKPRPSITREHA